jgi:hypothetical protein
MPRTSHGVTNDQTVGKRSVVVRAMCAHSEKLIATPDQDCVFAINLSGDRASFLEIANRESTFEIGYIFCFCHSSPSRHIITLEHYAQDGFADNNLTGNSSAWHFFREMSFL